MPPSSVPPCEISRDTFLVRAVHQTDFAALPINALVIRGEQPVVVDSGAGIHADTVLEQIFAVVEPGDVRWLFLSHDDPDHAGNVAALLDACPAATLVTTSIAAHRLSIAGMSVPPQRMMWLADDDVLDAGDRVLVPLRPPLYDAPATRGLVDTSTNLFWAADCFGVFSDAAAASIIEASEREATAWRDGFVRFHQWNTPWFEAVDAGWWQRSIARLAARPLTVVASAHGPVLRGSGIDTALDLLAELPALPVVPVPLSPTVRSPDLERLRRTDGGGLV